MIHHRLLTFENFFLSVIFSSFWWWFRGFLLLYVLKFDGYLRSPFCSEKDAVASFNGGVGDAVEVPSLQLVSASPVDPGCVYYLNTVQSRPFGRGSHERQDAE